ncbi:hypothetical protein ACTFIU_006398 [Dictyostelium citrinum]
MGYREQQNPDAVDRLDLAYRDIIEINPQIVDRFGPYVKELDLSNNNLEKDLTILEGFKRLTTLVLDNNRITHHIKFPLLPQLHTLWINSNQISNLSVFVDKVCESFPNLRTFSMLKNEACPNFFNGHSLREYKDYRLYIISRLKCVQILDSTPVTSEERVDAVKLYGNFNTVTQSLANSTPKPILAAPEVEVEDDPKKKREEKLKKTLEEKEQKKKEKQERRERRRLKREEKEERTFRKLQEKQKLQQQQPDTDSTITNKDDFTSDEDEDNVNSNNNNNNIATPVKPTTTKNSLPVFSSEQSPASTILPPNPQKQSAYESHDIADDEAFTADSSDHSDLPLYKNSTITPPPPPNTLLSPQPNQNKPQNNDDNDNDDDDDDEEESETESSDWSSEALDDDDEEVNQINSKLPTKMTLRDQYYQGDDDDDDDDDESEEEYTHFPVRSIKK